MTTNLNNTENSHSNELGALFEALSKAQGKIEHALKDKKNPFFKSSYADLASVWEACREPLTSNGLCIIQTIEGTKDAMYMITYLGHSSGQWMKSKMPLVVMKQDPQSIGSAVTYAKRYSLSALVGICSAEEDDDGEKAMGRKVENKTKPIDPEKHEEILAENKKMIDAFLSKFDKEDHLMIIGYLQKYSTHWKKGMVDSINDYRDSEKFITDFSKWKNQHMKAA